MARRKTRRNRESGSGWNHGPGAGLVGAAHPSDRDPVGRATVIRGHPGADEAGTKRKDKAQPGHGQQGSTEPLQHRSHSPLYHSPPGGRKMQLNHPTWLRAREADL